MSGSESMSPSKGPWPLTMALRQAPPPPSQSQNMQLSLGVAGGAAHNRPVSSSALPPPQQHQPNATASVPEKKRRGRPRKYRPEVNSPAILPQAPSCLPNSGGRPTKKMRGRTPDAPSSVIPAVIQSSAAGSTGLALTPHIFTVSAGEDISAKVMGIAEIGRHAVCVMSGNGAISKVTLCQSDTSAGCVTYEGKFAILSLSGSFHQLENNGPRSRSGCLSVSLSSPDGKVFGGNVAGVLIAASPVQMVVGTFMPDGQREPNQPVGQMAISSPTLPPPQVPMTPSSSQSRGTVTESSSRAGRENPLLQNIRAPLDDVILLPWKFNPTSYD